MSRLFPVYALIRVRVRFKPRVLSHYPVLTYWHIVPSPSLISCLEGSGALHASISVESRHSGLGTNVKQGDRTRSPRLRVPFLNSSRFIPHSRSLISFSFPVLFRVRVPSFAFPHFPLFLFLVRVLLFAFPHSRSLVSPPCLLHDSSFVVVRMCVWGTLMGSSPTFQNECGVDHDRGNAG